MKKQTLIVTGIVLFAVIALILFAAPVAVFAGPNLPRDGEGTKAQGPSWDATLSQSVTSTASQNITISGRLWYEFTPVADCKGRLMNTTTKATWTQFNLYSKAPFRGSNDSTTAKAKAVYFNLSGCTGDYRAQ